MSRLKCPLGEDCDMTLAWMMGAERAKDTIKAQAAEIEKLRAALRETLEVASRCEGGTYIERARAALGGGDE